jgi:hypothetical protein
MKQKLEKILDWLEKGHVEMAITLLEGPYETAQS